ncbi:MAG: UDP-glucose 4-epimerase [Chloroflexi bacterium]|nr:UDP-glucose 4-epimerase [Chloroflexota bacterium]
MLKKALITGAAGFIGSNLTHKLLDKNIEVLAIDDFSSGKINNIPKKHKNLSLNKMSILDENLEKLIMDFNPDITYHLAAQISVSSSTKNPLYDAKINIMGSINLLEIIKKLDQKHKFIYVTSGGTVYGEPKNLPAPENNPIEPLSQYGASKYSIENYLKIYNKLYQTKYTILRLGNVYGPKQDPHGEAGVVAIFIKAMLTQKHFEIYGDGKNQRDYIYVDDVINAIMLAAESNEFGPFNIGTGIGTSTNKIFSIISKYCEFSDLPIYSKPRPGDINKIILDINKAKKEINWFPKFNIDEGIKRTVDWFRKNVD